MTQHDLVDVLGRDAGIGQGIAGNPHNQAFHGFADQLAKGGMGPTDDAGSHLALLCRTLVVFLRNFLGIATVTITWVERGAALPLITRLGSVTPSRWPQSECGERTGCAWPD